MKPYYSLTNTIFDSSDMNEWDYATLVAIACNNLPFVQDADSKTTEIETGYVSAETLLDTLKIENDNRKRNRDKINESLTKLAKSDVVKVIDVKEISKRKYFKFSQQIQKTGANQGFSSITAEEFEKITFGIEKATDKVKALACYVSIAHRIFRATKMSVEKQASFNWVSNLSNFVCWDTLEVIGKNYNTGRKAVAKTVEMLISVEAIAVKTVRRKDKNKEQKLIFAKFSDKDELHAYVAEQIAGGEYVKANDKVKVDKADKVEEVEAIDEVEQIEFVETEQTIEQEQEDYTADMLTFTTHSVDSLLSNNNSKAIKAKKQDSAIIYDDETGNVMDAFDWAEMA